jgi:hypothetical protein
VLQLTRSGLVYYLQAPADTDTEAWRALLNELGVNRASQTLQRGLMLQVLSAGRGDVINRQHVLFVLGHAWRGTTLSTVYTGVERRRQPRSAQRSTKELLVGFRWLWAVYLRERGWSAAHVAHLMGYDNSNEAAKGLFRTVSVGMRAFLACGTGRLLAVLAQELVRCTDDAGPVKSLEDIAQIVAACI